MNCNVCGKNDVSNWGNSSEWLCENCSGIGGSEKNPEDKNEVKRKKFTDYLSRFLLLLFSPKGKATRLEFFVALIFLASIQTLLVIYLIITCLKGINSTSSIYIDTANELLLLIGLSMYCLFAASIKRWRDLGASLWIYVALFLIPAGFIVLLPMCIFVSSNKLNQSLP